MLLASKELLTTGLEEYTPTILVVTARKDEEAAAIERTRFDEIAQGRANTTYIDAITTTDLEWLKVHSLLNNADALILPGSSCVDLKVPSKERDLYLQRVTPIARLAVREDIDPEERTPILGICLGHQMIHLANGGIVERDPDQAETGPGILYLTKKGKTDPITEALPGASEGKLEHIFNHKDSVVKPAPGSVLLGSTERNLYSFTKLGSAWTIQSHPEDVTIARLLRAMKVSEKSPNGKYKKTYPLHDTPEADKFVKNFITIVRRNAENRLKIKIK